MLDIVNNLAMTSVLSISGKNAIEVKCLKIFDSTFLSDKKYIKILLVKHYILPIVHTIYLNLPYNTVKYRRMYRTRDH